VPPLGTNVGAKNASIPDVVAVTLQPTFVPLLVLNNVRRKYVTPGVIEPVAVNALAKNVKAVYGSVCADTPVEGT